MNSINRVLSVLLIVFSLTATTVFVPFSATAYGTGSTFDYDLFQQFLDKYTRKDVRLGKFKLTAVDYIRINSEKGQTGSLYRKLLDHFDDVDPSKLASRKEKIAFWINAYNFGAITLIIDHYPVDSIRDRKINFFKTPWNIKILSVGGEEYSLDQIEHSILLAELAEPMAHFGIVCASLSCPNLNTQVFRAEKIMDQLADMAKAFLADRAKGLFVDRSKNKVYFSRIFKFDKKTFPDGGESAVKIFADHFAPEDLEYLQNSKYSILYLDYDWSLNSTSK